MLTSLFMGLSMVGAEWVLYLLILLSFVSVVLIFERIHFYHKASKGLAEFRDEVRKLAKNHNWVEASKVARTQADSSQSRSAPDLESALASALLSAKSEANSPTSDVLAELAQDSVLRNKIYWEKNLAFLGTIGSNAPFIGLFGTVLGIIKAFHDLAQQTAQGAQAVSAGISEALVATAIGILVAIPAVVAFNFFQRRVKVAVTEAEALKSFLISQILTK